MPRLFPSFRSKGRRTQGQYDSDRHYDNGDFYYQHLQPPSVGSTSRRVLPANQHGGRGEWEEELLERPSRASMGYAPFGTGYIRSQGRPTVQDYHDTPSLTDTLTEETQEELDYDSNPPPIVQRENSFSHLQDVFTDPPERMDRTVRPVTDITLPSEGQRYTRTDIQTPTEVHGVYPSASHPVMVNNTGFESVRPEYGHVPENVQYAEPPHERHYSRRHRKPSPEHYAMSSNSSDSRDYSDPEYPPYVLVVAPGHHGKEDTYYVVPGGAPVIFEDEQGNELTRVGDFSGNYRPRSPRPVIIQDEQGREIARMHFDDRDSYDSEGDSDDMYYSSRLHKYQHGRRSRERDEYDGRSYHSSSRSRARDLHYEEYDNRSRSSPSRTKSPPNVVYVDPATNQRYDIRDMEHSSDRSSRRHGSSSRSSHKYRDPGAGRYGSPVINLDEVRRARTGAGSSASSETRSYNGHGSSNRPYHSPRRYS